MSQIKSILVPTDFSKGAQSALAFAERLASATGASLHLLYTDNEVLLNHQATSQEYRDEYHAQMTKKLIELVDANKELDIDYTVNSGDAAGQILAYAKDNQVDMIVMGRTGRSAISEMLLGSITQQVIHKAKCPVTSVSV